MGKSLHVTTQKWKNFTINKLIKNTSMFVGLCVADHTTSSVTLCHSVYGLFLCLTLIIALILSIESMDMLPTDLLRILIIATQILLTLTSVYAIFSAVVLHKDKLKNLDNQIEVVENRLKEASTKSIHYEPKKLCIQVVATMVLVLVSIAFDGSWLASHFMVFYSLIQLYINVIIISILTVQVYLYSTCIGYLFKHLNYIFLWQISHKVYYPKNGIIYFLQTHEDICQLIALVNEIFSLKIFLLISNIIINILVSADRLINFAIKQMKGDVLVIISSVLLMVIFIVSTIFGSM